MEKLQHQKNIVVYSLNERLAKTLRGIKHNYYSINSVVDKSELLKLFNKNVEFPRVNKYPSSLSPIENTYSGHASARSLRNKLYHGTRLIVNKLMSNDITATIISDWKSEDVLIPQIDLILSSMLI